MSPPELDRDVVCRRLRFLQEACDQLAELASLSPDELAQQPITRAAIERFVQILVDMAADVNTHLVLARLGQVPSTAAESFALAAQAGALPLGLARSLAPAAGLRNLLVHRYADIDLGLLAQALPVMVERFSAYVTEIARWMAEDDHDR